MVGALSKENPRKRTIDVIEDSAKDNRVAKKHKTEQGQIHAALPQQDVSPDATTSPAEPERRAGLTTTQTGEDVAATLEATPPANAASEEPIGSGDNADGLDYLFEGSSPAREEDDAVSSSNSDSLDSLFNGSSPPSSPDHGKGAGEAPLGEAKAPHARGIYNYSHCCYVASTIQALLSVKPFAEFYKVFMNPEKIRMLQKIHRTMQYVHFGSDAGGKRSEQWAKMRLALPNVLKAELLVSRPVPQGF